MTKKKILILGSSGLIGHTVYLFLKKSNLFLLYNLAYSRKVDKETKLLDATDFNLLKKYLETIKPDIIVNCIGILISESNANRLDLSKLSNGIYNMSILYNNVRFSKKVIKQ